MVGAGQMSPEQLNASVCGQRCQLPARSGECGQNVGLDGIPVPPVFRPHWMVPLCISLSCDLLKHPAPTLVLFSHPEPRRDGFWIISHFWIIQETSPLQ